MGSEGAGGRLQIKNWEFSWKLAARKPVEYSHKAVDPMFKMFNLGIFWIKWPHVSCVRWTGNRRSPDIVEVKRLWNAQKPKDSYYSIPQLYSKWRIWILQNAAMSALTCSPSIFGCLKTGQLQRLADGFSKFYGIGRSLRWLGLS